MMSTRSSTNGCTRRTRPTSRSRAQSAPAQSAPAQSAVALIGWCKAAGPPDSVLAWRRSYGVAMTALRGNLDDFRGYFLVANRLLLLVHDHLDLHPDLRRHLPSERPVGRHEGRLDHRPL